MQKEIKYTPVFSDLEGIFEEVSKELSKISFNDNVKMAEKTISTGQMPVSSVDGKKSRTKKVREYVDISQNDPENL